MGRQRLSLLRKLELIEYHAKEGATCQETSEKFSVTKSSVSSSIGKKCSLVTLYNSTREEGTKAFVYSELAVINSELAKWYRKKQRQSKNFAGISQICLKRQVTKILRECKIESFKFTSKWIKEFVRKNNVTLNKKPRAKKSNSDNDTNNDKALPQGSPKGNIVSKTKKLPVIPKKQKISAKQPNKKQTLSKENKNVARKIKKIKTKQQKISEENKNSQETKKNSINQKIQSTSLRERPIKKINLLAKSKVAIKHNNPENNIISNIITRQTNIAIKSKNDFLEQVGLVEQPSISESLVVKPTRRTRNSCNKLDETRKIQIETNNKLTQLSKRKKIKQNNKVTNNSTKNNNNARNKNDERASCDESLHLEIRESENQEKVTTDNSTDNDLEQTEELFYYDAIERGNKVEFVCKQKPQSETLHILNEFELINSSENITQSQQPEESTEDPEPSTSNAIEELNVSCLESGEDVFKNLRIQVLPHGFVDEIYEEDDGDKSDDEFKDDNDFTVDGAEADDEFEDGEDIDDGFEDDIDGQSSQGQAMPPPNQIPQQPNSMQGGYRPPMAPGARPPNPRGGQPGGMRMPGGNPRPPMNQRAPGMRNRAPMVRPRGAGGLPPMRGQMRPRMVTPQNGIRPGQSKPIAKRNPDQNIAGLQAKRKRVEVLTPSDKEDDDCQVIFTQPKNTGLPQIEHIQGASEAVDNAIMKLPDSITLSVRPPAPKSASSPQKSEAKAVANVLASRGITVTPSAKPKEAPKQASPSAMSLNGAVSIVPPSKGGAKPADGLPTVDLTDDSPSDSANRNRPGLPYRCDLCPATYPNAMGLNKHRQTYHKTTSGMSELGIPLINLKQPGIMQKMSQFGVNHYIPMPNSGPGGTYAIPIINSKTPGALVSALDSTQILTLGPVRHILRSGVSNNTNNAGKK